MVGEYQKWKLKKVNEKERFEGVLKKLLLESEIICSTLSSSGSEKLEPLKNFIDTIIIDEVIWYNRLLNVVNPKI